MVVTCDIGTVVDFPSKSNIMTGFSEECDTTFPSNFSAPPDGNWALHLSFTGTYKITHVKERIEKLVS